MGFLDPGEAWYARQAHWVSLRKNLKCMPPDKLAKIVPMVILAAGIGDES